MASFLKHKNSLTNDALIDLADFVVPKLTANMRAANAGGGDAKRIVTALTVERARKLAEDSRALIELLEAHASSVSTASMDSLIDDTMLCILAFAAHKSLLAFRGTSRRNRALIDSLPTMRVARLRSVVPLMKRITKCESLGCVLDGKTIAAIQATRMDDNHRAVLKRMPLLRTVRVRFFAALITAWPGVGYFDRLDMVFDGSLPSVVLSAPANRSNLASSETLRNIERALGRTIGSILFAEHHITGLTDPASGGKPRLFQRLALATTGMESLTLYQLREIVVDHLVLRVEQPHAANINKLLTEGAPMQVSSSSSRRGNGPTLMLKIQDGADIEWSREALMVAGASFSRIFVHRIGCAENDGLKQLLDETPELAQFVVVAYHYMRTNDEDRDTIAAHWKKFTEE